MPYFQLPENYCSRQTVSYFDDIVQAEGQPLYQPEVYEVADYLLRKTGRSTVIDFGCGFAGKLVTLKAARRIGIDFGSNIEYCRAHHGDTAEWITADFAYPDSARLVSLANSDCVVICADVVEHLLDPIPLLEVLAECCERGAIVLTSTPDRVRAWGREHRGPPPNPSHVREWALDEYRRLLDGVGLFCNYAGYTLNNDRDLELETIITIHDKGIRPLPAALGGQRPHPLALLALYNEADCIEQVVRDWLVQGCDLHIIDNWSTDASWDILSRLAADAPGRIILERYPETPSPHYEWRDILRRKEAIAAQHPGRWIIHTDADELRRSPFPGMTMAEGLYLARDAGANRVNFTIINFRPTADDPDISLNMGYPGSAFEFASRPDEFDQAKAWLQPAQQVDLVTSGGHTASFDGATELPYRFLLMHYPIRSAEHGRRKILTERVGRWSPEERAMGWHVHYDGYHVASQFLWDPSDLIRFTEAFWDDFGLAIVTDIAQHGLRRSTFKNASACVDSDQRVKVHALSERITAIEAAFCKSSAGIARDNEALAGLVHRLRLKHAQEVGDLRRQIEAVEHNSSNLEAELELLRKELEANDRNIKRRYRAAIQRLQSLRGT
jgi:SAM-dependent methyltransferase